MSSDSFAAAATFSLEDDELLVAEALFALLTEVDGPTESATVREYRAWMLLDTIAVGRGLSVTELRQQAETATEERRKERERTQ